MGKFVPLSENMELFQSLNCVVQLGWGGQGAREQKLSACDVEGGYTSVPKTSEQPLFSLFCFVLHKDHSPQ